MAHYVGIVFVQVYFRLFLSTAWQAKARTLEV